MLYMGRPCVFSIAADAVAVFAQEALQDNINRVGAALGECNFFGGG